MHVCGVVWCGGRGGCGMWLYLSILQFSILLLIIGSGYLFFFFYNAQYILQVFTIYLSRLHELFLCNILDILIALEEIKI